MKKFVQIGLWLLAIALVIGVLRFVSKKQSDVICTGIEVSFSDTLDKQYIDKNHVIDLIEEENGTIVGQPIKKYNIAKIEKKLNDDPYIKHAEVFKKINGELVIKAIQRNPVVRVINKENISFYIGKEGVLMPVSRKVQARMIIASGNIEYSPDFDTITNIHNKDLDTNKNILVLRDLYTLVTFINNDRFWEAQTQQIYLTKNNEFELVPLVGNHIIQFGGIDRYEEKFRNLEATYKKGFPAKGWNRYNEIDLKYKNQVVCRKVE
jgi:cell division protein FtsQ